MRLTHLVIAMLFSVTLNFAQGEASLFFLSFQQSIPHFGAGQTGTAHPNDYGNGYYMNPAILGHFSRNNDMAFSFMPVSTEWLGFEQISYNNFGFQIGRNFNSDGNGIPLSLGFGYIHNKFSFETFLNANDSPRRIGATEDRDIFNSFSLGIGLDYYLLFNVGFSIKFIDSKLGASGVGENFHQASLNTTAFDFGTLIVFPISNLFLEDAKVKFANNNFIRPKVNFSIGYSIQNLGDEVFYIENVPKDPIYRTARLGYSLNLGSRIELENVELDLIDYTFTADAEDLLVKRRTNINDIAYDSFLGNISISNNLLSLKGDEEIVIHKGHIIDILETVSLMFGNMNGRGFRDVKTNGFGLSTRGLFKLLSISGNDSFLKYLLNHLVIEYNNANYLVDTRVETNFTSFNISWRNFSF